MFICILRNSILLFSHVSHLLFPHRTARRRPSGGEGSIGKGQQQHLFKMEDGMERLSVVNGNLSIINSFVGARNPPMSTVVVPPVVFFLN